MTGLWEYDTYVWKNYQKREEIDKKIMEIRDLVYPELKDYAHFGIFNPKCPESSKIAYDIIQVLRNKLAWNREPNGGYTVDFGEPLQAGKEELIKVKIIKESED